MVKIRLRRVGAKKQPSYRIVVADSRSPRDGRFIENIGHYNPRTDPPTVVIKQDRAIYWLSVGAQPSDAVARFFRKLELPDKVKQVHKGSKIEDLVSEPEAAAPPVKAKAKTEAKAEPKTKTEAKAAEAAEKLEEAKEVSTEAPAELAMEAEEAVTEVIEEVSEEAAEAADEAADEATETAEETVEAAQEAVEDAQIAVLDLSTRVVNALEAAEIATVSQLQALRKQGSDALTAISGIGAKAAEEIEEKLDAYGGGG